MRLLFHAYTFHACTTTCVLPRDVYFHAFTSTRRVFPCVYFHEMCTLHDTSKRGPRKHVTGMHCSIAVVPHKITRGKTKLQLSGTVCLLGSCLMHESQHEQCVVCLMFVIITSGYMHEPRLDWSPCTYIKCLVALHVSWNFTPHCTPRLVLLHVL